MPFSLTYTPNPLPPTTVQLSIIAELRRAMLVAYADTTDLDAIGAGNYGLPRPTGSGNDLLYSQLIQLLAWCPKTIPTTLHTLMRIVFGSVASLRSQGQRPWKIYEVNPNEIIIELPVGLIGTSQNNASYLHGFSGFAAVPSGGPFNQFTTRGNVNQAVATTAVGLNVYVMTAPETYTSYTILAASYVAATNTSTVTVSASTLPAGGGTFYIDVPGDGTTSQTGNYTASSGFVGTFFTGRFPSVVIGVFGDATRDLAIGDTVTLLYSGMQSSNTIVSKVFNSAEGTTTVNLGTSIPGVGVGSIVRPLEIADGTDAPHTMRVYMSGLGLYEVVQQYLDLLVRSAGIVVRVEVI